jgi:hypothetical protein
MDVTLRDQEGNYMGTAYHPIIHLIGTFNSIGAPDVQKVDQRLALDYVYHEMYHYDEKINYDLIMYILPSYVIR